MSRKISSFREFWPRYLRAHSQPLTRAWHYAGTLLGVVLVVAATTFRVWWLGGVAILLGYGFAWVGHACVECNRPQTFGHPLWSLLSDLRMFLHFVTGTLRGELEKARDSLVNQ